MLRARAEAGVKRFPPSPLRSVYGDTCQKGDALADETTPCEARKTPSDLLRLLQGVLVNPRVLRSISEAICRCP